MADSSTSEFFEKNKKKIITNYITNKYDLKKISVGVIGRNSALEIMDGAKDVNLKTVCICKKGRELPYIKYKRLCDELILVDKFSDIIFEENKEKILNINK